MKKIITFLHSNDMHSNVENIARQASVIEQIRLQNQQIKTILVDSGDVLAGSIYNQMFGGKVEAELLTKLKYDYLTFGNHEFDQGSIGLSYYLKQVSGTFVTSNIDFSKDQQISKYLKKDKIKSFDVIEIDSVKIGILGVTTLETLNVGFPSRETKFSNPFTAIKNDVDKLKQKNVDKIIVLSHLGDDYDIKLAQEIKEIDFIFGAHTHRLIKEPIVIKQDQNQKCLIFQTGSEANYLGALSLFIKENQEVDYQYELIDTKKFTKNTEVDKLLDGYRRQITIKSNQKIGETLVKLEGRREVIRKVETNLGNLVADAYLNAAQKLGYDVDAALINSGGIRKSILKGEIFYKDVIEVLPFGKMLTVLKVTGEQLIESVVKGEGVQVANLKIIKHPFKIKLLIAVNGNYVEVDPKAKYLIATNNFVALGKGNFVGFNQERIIATDLQKDSEVLSQYIKSYQQPLDYQVENRITDLDQ